MRILLVRHGQSEGNIDPAKYVEQGDSNVDLTEEGWRQTYGTGLFLRDYYKQSASTKWPLVFVSSLNRAKQSFAAIAHAMDGLFPHPPKLQEDVRLIEKFFGAASALAFPPKGVDPKVAEAITMLSKAVYRGDPFVAKHLFGESTKDTMIAVKSFIDGTLARDIKEGQDDILIVCHGAVIQAFIMNWAHIQMRHKNRIGNPGNGDVIAIEGTPKSWTVTQIYDGENAVRANRDLLANAHRYTVADLPPVPSFLKAKP